jgi:hypothetical protein
MIKKITFTIFALSAILLLSACQFTAGGAQTTSGVTATPKVVKAASTARPTATPRPTLASTATPSPFVDVQAAASAYADALLKGDYTSAADMVSTYSLMVANLTQGELKAQMKASGDASRIANVKYLSVQQAGSATVLVHVNYLSGKDGAARDEVWPFRNENGTWKYNWNNLVDFHTLTVDPQTTNGVTFIPQRLLRYSDRTRLELMGQNHTNEPIVFGQPNETLAVFRVGDQTVTAEKTHLALDALRTTSGLALEIKGYYEVYPSAVAIRKWNDFNEKPWFSFVLP